MEETKSPAPYYSKLSKYSKIYSASNFQIFSAKESNNKANPWTLLDLFLTKAFLLFLK